MEAPLGHNPSFVWRSVWKARSVTASGSRWRTGNGESMNVWNDPWIKNNPCFKPITPIIDGLEELKVAALLSHDRTYWNVSLIRALFNDQDVASITNIVILSLRFSEEKLIWSFTRDGIMQLNQVIGLHALLPTLVASQL